MANVYNRIGILFKTQSVYDSVIYYYIKAKDIFFEIGDIGGHLATLINTAFIHERMGMYQKAHTFMIPVG